MKQNGEARPWIAQNETDRVSLRRIGCRQVAQTTRTGAGPDGPPAGESSSLPGRPDATARESRAWSRGELERDSERVGPAVRAGPGSAGRR